MERTAVRPAPADPAPATQPFSVDLDLDLDQDEPESEEPAAGRSGVADRDQAIQEATREAGATRAREVEIPSAREAEPESDEIDLDLDDVFVLEMEEEEPASLVKPPPDMLAGAPRRPAWALDAEVAQEPASPPLPPIEVAPPSAPSVREPTPAEAFEAPAPAPTDEASWEEISEIDLGEMGRTGSFELVDPFRHMLESDPSAAATGAPSARLDAEELERTAAGLYARAPEKQEDLLTEAEVLARYGLEDKAIERLHDALRADPRHLEAYALLIQLHLDRGRLGPAAEAGQKMAQAVGRKKSEVWEQVRRKLASVGISVEETQAKAPPRVGAPEPLPRADFGGMFEDLSPPQPEPSSRAPEFEPDFSVELEVEPPAPFPIEPMEPLELPAPIPPAAAASAPPATAAPAAPSPSAKPRPSRVIDRELEALIGTAGKGKPAKRPAPPSTAPPAAAKPAIVPPSVMPPPAPPAAYALPLAPTEPVWQEPLQGNDLFDPRGIAASLDDLDDDFVVPGLRADGPPISPSPDASSLDDTGMSWLDEAEALRSADAAPPPPPPAARSHSPFPDDDFFDLAGELEQELEREVGGGDLLAGPVEQTLEEIVEGFKKGVSENLSSTDYDTHFNLGIAYREMGLIDEAIGEFQLAAKDRNYLVSCCSNLGLCFLEKGIPELAVKWYRRGLDAPGVSEDDSLGLLYDLGNAYLSTGDVDSAYKTFVELYGINSNYRDVVARIEELGRPH